MSDVLSATFSLSTFSFSLPSAWSRASPAIKVHGPSSVLKENSHESKLDVVDKLLSHSILQSPKSRYSRSIRDNSADDEGFLWVTRTYLMDSLPARTATEPFSTRVQLMKEKEDEMGV